MRPVLASLLLFAVAACSGIGTGPWPSEAGVTVFKESAYSVKETVDRLAARAPAHGGSVDAGAADGAAPSERFVFVSMPQLEAPMVAAGPRAGIDLPMRVRVWEEGGAVYLTYQAPSAIARRAGLAPDAQSVERFAAALDALTNEATAP